MSVTEVDALLALRADGRLLLGRDRIALLEAVMQYGSLSEAARKTGSSYKAVWDAVQAVNNLLPSPAFVTRVGGSRGGSAEATPLGRKLIAAFRLLEERLARISNAIVTEELQQLDDLLLWGLAVKVSVRNVFHCTIVELREDPVEIFVTLRVSADNALSAIVPRDALLELRLAPGRSLVAFVNASFITLAPASESHVAPHRNRIEGRVIGRVDGSLSSEIRLEIGDGKVLTAVVPISTALDLNIQIDDQLDAFFSASHVILASD